MTITEFLTARYDEDEAVARRHTFDNPANPRLWNGPGQYPVMTGKSLLADIAAKRAIVKFADVVDGMAETIYQEFSSYPDDEGADLLKILVQPYADHPDFDPAWRVA